MAELDLVAEERRELARSVIGSAVVPPEPFGVYLVSADAPAAELARSVETEVFAEWFGNTRELLDREYGAFEAASYFILVLDHRRLVPAGAIRMTLPSELGLKALHDIETVWQQELDAVLAATGVAWDPNRVWDVVTAAVHAEYRGKATDGMIALAMYQSVVRTIRRGGGRWFVAVLDVHVMQLMHEMTSEPYHAFAGIEPVEYLDSPASNVFWVDLDEYEPRLRFADAWMHGVLFEGVGIESVVRPADLTPIDAWSRSTSTAAST